MHTITRDSYPVERAVAYKRDISCFEYVARYRSVPTEILEARNPPPKGGVTADVDGLIGSMDGYT